MNKLYIGLHALLSTQTPNTGERDVLATADLADSFSTKVFRSSPSEAHPRPHQETSHAGSLLVPWQ